jgi:uncharacterized protein
MASVEPNNNLAFVLNCLNSSKTRLYFGKTIVQKIVYFIQELMPESNFRYDYILYYFGPYSGQLERDLTEYEFEEVISITSSKHGKGYEIKLEDHDIFKQFSKTQDQEKHLKKIENIIRLFDSDGPAGLELKATLFFLWEKAFEKTDPIKIKNELIQATKVVKPNFTDDSFERCFKWLVEKKIMRS